MRVTREQMLQFELDRVARLGNMVSDILGDVLKKVVEIDGFGTKGIFDKEEIEAIQKAITITLMFNEQDCIESLEEDIDLMAENWDECVASNGEEDTKHQWDQLIAQARRLGMTVRSIYPKSE